MGEGELKAKKVADSLRAETADKSEAEKKEMATVMNELTKISKNPELAKMYQDNAQLGADNLAGELPLLKVHAVGKSTKNELADGSEPTDGFFFYKPTREQFKELECHILTISKGFRAPGMEQKDGTAPMVFNQIVGGVIINEGELKPFVLYMTGLKLKNLWEFGKVASKYTHLKPVGIPMFALTVKLTTEKQDNNYGKSWVINFEIQHYEDNSPVLVSDPGEFEFLKDHVGSVEDTIAQIIASKTVGEEVPEQTATPVTETKPVEETDKGEEMPF